MQIQKAVPKDFETILAIYESARQFMRQQGNPNQWIGGYPSKDQMQSHIQNGNCYVCIEEDQIFGVFCYFPGPDPTYAKIYEGQWCNDEPYGVIHRIAVARHRKGVAECCYRFVLEQCPNLRIDTHEDNIPMQRSLAKNGFQRYGIIYLENGDPRIAYQKAQM